MDSKARKEAQKQWNKTPCGAVETEEFDLDYFKRVADYRYEVQPWMHKFFDFENYKGAKVLEIGVGHGTDLLQFGKAGAECYGVDITKAHLELAQKNFELNGIPVHLRETDGIDLGYPDRTFDVVYSFGVIHHIPEADQVLKEVARVLKPGGKVMLSVYNRNSAHYICSKIIRQGLLKGDLFKIGLDGVKATIEVGADGKEIKPYVQMYTKSSLKKILDQNFNVEQLTARQLYLQDIIPSFGGRLPTVYLPGLESRLGWYVAAVATKE
jgi:2-polyprenyl-3-methyl-5-hydroxy-6-metoxy-1,4-benzoquinol methylase